jgi:hypothetical protein
MDTYGTKFRKAHEQPFERCMSMHRLIGTEGFAHIDTHTAKALQAQCGLCSGSCHDDQNCPIQFAQMPAEPPQPYVHTKAKPSLWARFKAWLIGDEQ